MKHQIFVLAILLLMPLRMLAVCNLSDFATMSVYSVNKCINVELKGGFENTMNKSLPLIPIIASISDSNLLDIVFTSSSGDVFIQITTDSGMVYDETIPSAQQSSLSIPIVDYTPGVYKIEFKTAIGGYIYGYFTIL